VKKRLENTFHINTKDKNKTPELPKEVQRRFYPAIAE